MLKAADVYAMFESEYGSRLEPLGFRALGKCRWVRATKLPIREIVHVQLGKHYFAPGWGLSCGMAPTLKSGGFQRQSTDKNAAQDLNFDFAPHSTDFLVGFISGFTTVVPVEDVQRNADHFVPRILADFDKVQALPDFCAVFLEYQKAREKNGFFIWFQHRITVALVDLMQGRQAEGLAALRTICASQQVPFEDPVLTECINRAVEYFKGGRG